MKKIMIWGAGNYGTSAYDSITEEKYGIVDICDSNPMKIGKNIGDLTIQDISGKKLCDYDMVLLAANEWEDMYIHAKESGVPDEKIKIWNGNRIIDLEDAYSLEVHSQDGEELFLREEFFGVNEGFYVDVGAYHPMRFSNTLWAYMRGWKGINIEPNCDNYRLFNLMRPNDINVNVGISNVKSKMKYFQFDAAGLNTFDKERADLLVKQNDYKLIDIREVEVIPLQELLDQYDVNHIDFLDIDVEGKELEVIKSIDFKRMDIKLLLIEQLAMNLEAVLNSEIASVLKGYGYHPVSKFDRTVVYKKR